MSEGRAPTKSVSLCMWLCPLHDGLVVVIAIGSHAQVHLLGALVLLEGLWGNKERWNKKSSE